MREDSIVNAETVTTSLNKKPCMMYTESFAFVCNSYHMIMLWSKSADVLLVFLSFILRTSAEIL